MVMTAKKWKSISSDHVFSLNVNIVDLYEISWSHSIGCTLCKKVADNHATPCPPIISGSGQVEPWLARASFRAFEAWSLGSAR